MDEVDKQLGIAAEKLAELKADVAILQLRLLLKKFDPNQLRWPSGNEWGGRWRDAGGVAVAHLEGVYDPSRMSMCLAQQALDFDLCRMAKSNRCWESADMRYNNCMRNVYIPVLEVGR